MSNATNEVANDVTVTDLEQNIVGTGGESEFAAPNQNQKSQNQHQNQSRQSQKNPGGQDQNQQKQNPRQNQKVEFNNIIY